MHRVIYLFLIISLAACELEDWSKPGALVPPTADQDPGIPSLPVNGTLLHVETYGNPSDPLLIVIHGGPGDDFRSLLNARSFSNNGFFVVFYDQRGTGLSKREDRSQFEDKDAIKLFLGDLDALINHYKIAQTQKVFLLGHSWGAMLAAGYINEHPEKISGVVLAEPGGLTWPQTEEYLTRTNEVKLFTEAMNDALYPQQFIAGSSEHDILDYKATFFSISENAPGNVLGNPGPRPFWRYGAASREALTENADQYGFDFTTHLSQYTTKVLFFYSENNSAYGLSWAKTVSAPFTNVEIKMVENCGHEMLYFGWDDFYVKALTYLNQVK